MKKRWKLSAKWWHVSPLKRCLEDSLQWPLLIFKHSKCANRCIIFHHTRKRLHFYFRGAGADELLEKKLALCHLSEADVDGNPESGREGDYCMDYVTVLCFVLMLSHIWFSPSFSVCGMFQARLLEWVAICSSRGSSQPRDPTHISCISCIGKRILYQCTPCCTSLHSCQWCKRVSLFSSLSSIYCF